MLFRSLFVDGVKAILGVEPEVISGEEEARLSFMGATKELRGDGAPYLVIDIGGGSTEFVFGSTEVEFAKSQNIGCVRMSERHLSSIPPQQIDIERAIADIDEAILDAATYVPISQASTLIAVAGTATTVAAAALELDAYDRYSIHLARISAARAHEISRQFLQMNRDDIAALPYMHPGRVDVIAAGSLVLSRILFHSQAEEFVASESDILDGMAWSLAH